MKQFIIAWALLILFAISMIFYEDNNINQEQLYKVKYVAEEAAAASAQFVDEAAFSEGKLIFNKDEGTKAAEYYIKKNLNLDNNFIPLSNSYWSSKVNYSITYFDSTNTVFPVLYQDPSGLLTKTIASPTVVVRIDPGKGRYRKFSNPIDIPRVAAHAWVER